MTAGVTLRGVPWHRLGVLVLAGFAVFVLLVFLAIAYSDVFDALGLGPGTVRGAVGMAAAFAAAALLLRHDASRFQPVPTLIVASAVSLAMIPLMNLLLAGSLSLVLLLAFRRRVLLASTETVTAPADRLVASTGIAGCLLVGAALRLLTYEEAFERDLMVYATVADGWLRGAPLYGQMWDHKPPGVAAVYAAAIWLFGLGPAAIYALGVTAFALSLLGVAEAARRLGGTAAVAPAALIWTVLSIDPLLQANQPNVEVFMNAALIWALALLLPKAGRIAGTRATAMAGVLFFAASAFKQVSVFVAVAVSVALFADAVARPADQRAQAMRHAAGQAATMAGIAAVGWLAIFLLFYMFGDFPAFIYAVFDYNRYYSGEIIDNLYAALITRNLVAGFAVTVFGFAAALHLVIARRPGHSLVLAAYIGTGIAFAATGHGFPHYYQLMLPLIALSGGWILARVTPVSLRLGTAIIAVSPVLVAVAYLQPETVTLRKYGSSAHGVEAMESREIGLLLRDRGKVTGSFAHWGAEPGVYFWHGGGAPLGNTYNFPLLRGPRSEELMAQMMSDLDCLRPELIVANHRDMENADDATRWIRAHYAPTAEYGGFAAFGIWERAADFPAASHDPATVLTDCREDRR